MVLPAFRMKKMAERTTPRTTPFDRSWVMTTVAVVASMTMLDWRGRVRIFQIEPQSKAPMATVIITATRAAMGMRATQS